MGPRYVKNPEDGTWMRNINLVQAYNSSVNRILPLTHTHTHTHTHTRSLPDVYPVSAWI